MQDNIPKSDSPESDDPRTIRVVPAPSHIGLAVRHEDDELRQQIADLRADMAILTGGPLYTSPSGQTYPRYIARLERELADLRADPV